LKKMETFRRDFLGNVSHELKTPIFNIQGYVLTLLDGGLEDKTINREYLLRTEKSIDRMITIVEDLETISKLESGAEKLKIIKFDLLQMTKDVMEFLEMKAKQKNIQISFAANYEKPVFVAADRQQINQVMINLIDNSLKYGNENGKTKISFFDMDENILVEITDDGIGIEKQDVPRIFERFYRTDKSRSREQGGSGLGLAIVKHIIEAHKQTINVRSAIGAGSTFAFTLKKG
jgi:two-component system, OmpR family, phosphate regulon sensor histidine kinase PhoR